MNNARPFLSILTPLLVAAPLFLAPSVAFAADDTPAADESATPAAPAKKNADDAPKGDKESVVEKPGDTYYFVGLRYRGDVVPKFMENLFVDEGKTVYINSIGLEADIRKDGYSLIPALTYTSYSTGDILFLQKGKDATAAGVGNYSYVNSSLKAIYASVDLLWSTPISENVEFEYGFGAGIGVIFGSLIDNWVTTAQQGGRPADFTSSSGVQLWKCVQTGPPGCNSGDHQNSTDIKVNNYVEKSWFSGGSVPNIFPSLSFPELGLRFKPIPQMEARLGIGFSLTGFWFGLSGDYHIEKGKDDAPKHAASNGPVVRFGQ